MKNTWILLVFMMVLFYIFIGYLCYSATMPQGRMASASADLRPSIKAGFGDRRHSPFRCFVHNRSLMVADCQIHKVELCSVRLTDRVPPTVVTIPAKVLLSLRPVECPFLHAMF